VNLIGSYNYALVALSVLIAIAASYTALDLAGRVTAARGRIRAVWLLGGAIAMGTGIWSMHYIGMLAFILPVPVAYHWPTVLLSLFAAILASAIALYVVSRQRMDAFRAFAGSVLMGAGIASMHYIGMAAMRLPAMCYFDSVIVLMSVVFAVLISLAAIWITFHFRDEKTAAGWGKIAGAVVMGAAIPVMHYTGMAAAGFTLSGMPVDLSHAVSISTLGTAVIAAVTLIVLGLALLTSWMDRRFAVRSLVLQEVKLKQSEAYLAEAQRLSHTGSFGWRVSAEEILWSEETFRIFQYPRTAKPTVELILQRVHPEDTAFVRQTIERASSDGRDFDFESRLLMADGSVKHVHVVAHALSDKSDSLEFVGTVMDVTEQHQANRALEIAFAEIRKSEVQLRLIIDTIPGMVFTTSNEGKLEYVNVRILNYTGKDLAELADSRWTCVIHPDDVELALDAWLQSVATGLPHEAEWRMLRADGAYRWFHNRVESLRDDEGRIIRWYGLLHDIDDRKNAEEVARKAQVELAHVTRVMTMGELVASIAHEVNQPLGAIVTNGRTCVRLLSRDVPDIDKSLEVIGRMITDGMRASEVIKRIRDLLHKTPVEKVPLNINETIQEVIALVGNDVVRSKVELKAELEADLPPVLGDRIQLQQVILNLILNAKDAMSGVQTNPRELQMTSGKTNGGAIVVAVRDTGRGLDAKDVERIFDPFFTTKPEGTGLGLSISRTIIEAHGGTLWATQNEDKGATIQFTLPSGQRE
jgi:PAS domain S-box-containing protein